MGMYILLYGVYVSACYWVLLLSAYFEGEMIDLAI